MHTLVVLIGCLAYVYEARRVAGTQNLDEQLDGKAVLKGQRSDERKSSEALAKLFMELNPRLAFSHSGAVAPLHRAGRPRPGGIGRLAPMMSISGESDSKAPDASPTSQQQQTPDTAGATAAAAGTGAAVAAGADDDSSGWASFLTSSLLKASAFYIVAGLAGLAGVGYLTREPEMSPGVKTMVENSVTMAEAKRKGGPMVIEFYAKEDPFTREAARKGLGEVVEKAKKDGVNWVMLECNDVQVYQNYMRQYGVSVVPHFEFLDADGHRNYPVDGGPIVPESIERRMDALKREVKPQESELVAASQDKRFQQEIVIPSPEEMKKQDDFVAGKFTPKAPSSARVKQAAEFAKVAALEKGTPTISSSEAQKLLFPGDVGGVA